MTELDHITFRAASDFSDELDDIATQYGMDRSQMIRLLLSNSMARVEANGLEAFVNHEDGVGFESARK